MFEYAYWKLPGLGEPRARALEWFGGLGHVAKDPCGWARSQVDQIASLEPPCSRIANDNESKDPFTLLVAR